MKYIEIDTKGEAYKFNCFFNAQIKRELFPQNNRKKLSKDEISNLIKQAEELDAKVVFFSAKTDSNNTSSLSSLKPSVINCLKHKDSCFISQYGIVYPCVGLPLPLGDIRLESLKKIVRDSEIIENLQNHELRIKGPCRECDDFQNCFGCRGRTFALTGDYLGSDPLCPKNQNHLDKITYLPMDTKDLIPQKSAMRVVTSLLKVGERRALVESTLSNKCPFIKKDGSLEEVVYMEIMAQSAACMNGFEKYDTGDPDFSGFLIGGQKINIYHKTYNGDKLLIDVHKSAKFGNFGILTATIKNENDLIAEGEIKIYHTN
ncbi:MAG: hypothetical protein CMM60_03300 [Rhodospirillaceae bacterium]|jgi:radical SAM protein with 4Fe4S-binding SPASM domain|nr:hypothetical protein [Rhodospirillaceae bacterium]|tara:strand:+ start:3937 stop:4887 length:951 start_codon:yes stop_codon:yes gene_type:complete